MTYSPVSGQYMQSSSLNRPGYIGNPSDLEARAQCLASDYIKSYKTSDSCDSCYNC